eukprot:TRINITY_DN7328_c0_g1_i1.p1 TRINITY_DN7328_c0_g1~~TRINITY_DN7328_c0_g1_i1.p1  ORF type:complete len:150 (-),score=33.63 TRINITY_DN7328_c0_g1_i1:120-569(-)
MLKMKIFKLRIPNDFSLSLLNCDWLQDTRKAFYHSINQQSEQSKSTFLSPTSIPPLVSTSSFFGMSVMGKDATRERVESILSSIKSTSVEWMVHPGYSQTKSDESGFHGDDFSRSSDREWEMNFLCDAWFKKTLQEKGFVLVSWKMIHE